MIRVAIDGPAGVGKSSTSKALAKYFGYAYLDTARCIVPALGGV